MIYTFADCVLDTQGYILYRAGRRTRLRPKVFQMLMYFLTHGDRVVSKQELCEQVRSAQAVSDAAIENCLKALRQVIGDDGRTQHIIQTLYGHGYRFVARITIHPHLSSLKIESDTGSSVAQGGVGAMPEAYVAAERRQLTVLCCELVDASHLATRFDPEDFHELVHVLHTTCTEIISRFDGCLAQYRGDGLLVYFGYPEAHEDDAQRAIRSGLGIVDALRQRQTRLQPHQNLSLAIRVGIHTGLVVVGRRGEDVRHDSLALGEPPILAAQLQRVAAPNTVAISAATYHLVQAHFECQLVGTYPLGTATPPLAVYRVLQDRRAQSHPEAVPLQCLTPFVGRESEVSLLRERWAQVRDGRGHVVVLSGEAGIGKSRLAQVLQEQIAHEPHSRLTCWSSPYAQHTPLYPLTEMLQRVCGWLPTDAPAVKLQKLETALARYHLELDEAVPLCASLLSLALRAASSLSWLWQQQGQREKAHRLLAPIYGWFTEGFETADLQEARVLLEELACG